MWGVREGGWEREGFGSNGGGLTWVQVKLGCWLSGI